MNELNLEFLMELLKTASPSGFEEKASELWQQEARKFTRYCSSDVNGSSIASIINIAARKTIILIGHIDEIGLIITYIDNDGFIYFKLLGGWDNQVLVGQRVRIYTKDNKIIKGVIGRLPIHQLYETKQHEIVAKVENLWIDTGYDKDFIKNNVSAGDYAVLDYDAEINGNRLIARGLDDRIGAFIVLEALKNIAQRRNENLAYVIHAIASSQEELGMRGAKTAAYATNPDIGIAIDVTFATDHPNANKQSGNIELGKGPVIAIGPNINKEIHKKFIKIAEEKQIPYQIEICSKPTGTDANIIQMTRSGVATGLISIPNRYMHSPCEIVDLNDIKNTIMLLTEFCIS